MKIWSTPLINIGKPRVKRYAKTLYKPETPSNKKQLLHSYTKLKVPHFFIYAKDKEIKNVEPINNSVVNRLYNIVPNPKITFNHDEFDKFDYINLMSNKDIVIDNNIINKYNELYTRGHLVAEDMDEEQANECSYIYKQIRQKILEINENPYEVTDMLVKYLYHEKNSKYKDTLWACFGKEILENIQNNLSKVSYCEVCGDIVKLVKNNYSNQYCAICAKEKERENNKIRKQKQREKLKMSREL